MQWTRALPVPTSKSVVITTTCELKAGFTWVCEMGKSTDYQQVISDHYQEWTKAGFTWVCEMGKSTDYQQVISDHYQEWTNNSGSGGSAHPWRLGPWYLHLDGKSMTTSVVFLLQESLYKCKSLGTLPIWTGEGCKLLVAKTKLCDVSITGCVLTLLTTQGKLRFRGVKTHGRNPMCYCYWERCFLIFFLMEVLFYKEG